MLRRKFFRGQELIQGHKPKEDIINNTGMKDTGIKPKGLFWPAGGAQSEMSFIF